MHGHVSDNILLVSTGTVAYHPVLLLIMKHLIDCHRHYNTPYSDLHMHSMRCSSGSCILARSEVPNVLYHFHGRPSLSLHLPKIFSAMTVFGENYSDVVVMYVIPNNKKHN